MTPKKIPIRRCVGCGTGKPKKELVRIVRNKEGEVNLDLSGRMPGRGAYLCRNAACLQRAVKRKSLERAFGAAVPEEVLERIALELPEEDGEDGG